MKVIIASDTHADKPENRNCIEKIVAFAKANDYSRILDVGDLHGGISTYGGKEAGIDLIALHWGMAAGSMNRSDFDVEIEVIGGRVVDNGSLVTLDDNVLFYMQHDLISYNKEISPEAWAQIVQKFPTESFEESEKYVLFGHTHDAYFEKRFGVVAINPGAACQSGKFIALDTEKRKVSFMDRFGRDLTIDLDGDIIGIREASKVDGKIITYEDCTEALVKGNAQSDRYHRIEDFLVYGEPLLMQVKNRDGSFQIVYGDKISDPFECIYSTEVKRDGSRDVCGVQVNAEQNGRELDVLLEL